MKILNFFAELANLPLYELVLIFREASYKIYRKVGYRNDLKDTVVLISESNFRDGIGIDKYDFTPNKTFVIGKFDSEFVGRLLLEKLNNEIKSVEVTYLTRH